MSVKIDRAYVTLFMVILAPGVVVAGPDVEVEAIPSFTSSRSAFTMTAIGGDMPDVPTSFVHTVMGPTGNIVFPSNEPLMPGNAGPQELVLNKASYHPTHPAHADRIRKFIGLHGPGDYVVSGAEPGGTWHVFKKTRPAGATEHSGLRLHPDGTSDEFNMEIHRLEQVRDRLVDGHHGMADAVVHDSAAMYDGVQPHETMPEETEALLLEGYLARHAPVTKIDPALTNYLKKRTPPGADVDIERLAQLLMVVAAEDAGRPLAERNIAMFFLGRPVYDRLIKLDIHTLGQLLNNENLLREQLDDMSMRDVERTLEVWGLHFNDLTP